MTSRLLHLAAAAAIATASFHAAAQAPGSLNEKEPSAMAMATDLVLVRPLGLVSTVLGSAVFVVALPFTVFQENGVEKTANKLIVEPARYTFARPLGEAE